MSVQNTLSDREALEQFKELHPELGSVHQIVALQEDEFVQAYASALEGGVQQARRVYKTAIAIQRQTALVWANLKDLASPFANNTLFNNIPQAFLDNQQAIPGYDRLFGNLDYVDCEPCRSVFGPAAYFVDLMRFVEECIAQRNNIPDECRLERRRPDLFNLQLDCSNANDLIAYIDLVNESLEVIVANAENPDAAQVLNTADFPGHLPFNLPLEEIRSYLKQLKLSLSEVYQTFATTPAAPATTIARESLALSPREFDIIRTELATPVDVEKYYGLDATQTLASLETVSTFLEKTGLHRQELHDLIFQDLGRDEVNAGLSRLFFINQVEDGLDHLLIEPGENEPSSFYHVPQERLLNLSSAKLDRVYRFVKLARKLGWSFADLDWALRALRPQTSPERGLWFDGSHAFVTIQDITKLDLPSFTIEAWVNPGRSKTNPILYKGNDINVDNPRTHFLFGLDSDNQLVLHTEQYDLSGTSAIPLGVFTHVAVSVSGSAVKFFINGRPEATTPATVTPIIPIGTTLNIGADLGYEFFAGSITEMRIWQGVRNETEIAANRYRRFTGQETGLVAYWALTEEASNRLSDRTPDPNHGVLGGAGAVPQPQWVPQDLVLDPFPTPLEQTAYQFNGADQYLAAREIRGLEINQRTGHQLTVEAWVHPAQHQANPIFRIGRLSPREPIFEFGLTSEGNLAIAIGTRVMRAGEPTIILNQFTHVAVAIDGARVQFYVNGLASANATLPEAFSVEGTELEIGRNLSENYFAGQIREVRLWNQARTAEQIRQTLPRVLPPRAPGLIGYWRLNQIETSMAKDLSFNQNHLLLGGIPEAFMPDRITGDRLVPQPPIVTTGTALELDGENDVVVLRHPENAGLGTYERLTLELWFKPTNWGQQADPLSERQRQRRQVIYSQGDAKAGVNAYLLEKRLYVIAWCDDGTQQIQETVLRSEPLSENQWHNLAITNDETRSRNSVEFRAYVNGTELTFVASTHVNNVDLPNEQKGYSLSRTGVAYLGGIAEPGMTRFQGEFNTSYQHHFAGQITDLRLWQRGKTAAEINAERYSAPELPDPDLVAYLPITEGNGNVIRDRTQTGYEGALARRNLVFLADNNTDVALTTLNSYYNPADGDALSWTNYAYTGRMYLPGQLDGALGVAFFSRRAENNGRDYRLQWRPNGGQSAFQLVTYPDHQPLTFATSNATPATTAFDRWYRFRIEVENNPAQNRTDMRAKVWLEDAPEPQEFQWIATDDGSDRPTSGTVGIWTTSRRGTQRFDDLQVTSLPTGDALATALFTESFESYAPGQNPIGWVDVGDRQISIPPEVLLDEDFESYRNNQDPSNWQDTGANHGLDVRREEVSRTGQSAQNRIFRATSSENDIHSHYIGTGSAHWSNYVYTGRLSVANASAGGIGVTVLSQYPEAQAYYRLGRPGGAQGNANQARVQLSVRRPSDSPSGTVLTGQVDSGVTLQQGTWYRFRIEVIDEQTRTRIRAKIWQDGTPEPGDYSIDAFDEAGDRFPMGTVGLWAAGNGDKRFDDLRVERLPASRIETAADDRLFRTADVEDNAARWQTIADYPVLLRPLSGRALRFDGQRQYLEANSLTGLDRSQFAIAVWIKPTRLRINPVFSWRDRNSARIFWFGVTGSGNVGLFTEEPGGSITSVRGVTSTEQIPVAQFTHIATSVDGNAITFFINGIPGATQTFPVLISFNTTNLQVGRIPRAYLTAELRDLRLWSTTRTAADFPVDRRYQQPDLSCPDLLGYWSLAEADGVLALDTSIRANHFRLGGVEEARQPILAGVSTEDQVAHSAAIVVDDAALQGLATIRQLQERHTLPVERLTALWFQIRHTGRDDGQTLFDRIFNARGVRGERWEYFQTLRWTVRGQENRMSDREIRSRLMGALQVSSEDLDRLVQRLSGAATVIALDSVYLTRLYHLAQSAKVLRLTVENYVRLLDLMDLVEVNTLEAFRWVSDRADWLQRTGISLDELHFLVNEISTDRSASPVQRSYTDANLRDLADNLTRQSGEFLATSSSFVSDSVNQAQSMGIFDVLQGAGILDDIGAVTAQYDGPINLVALADNLPVTPQLRQQILSRLDNTLDNRLLTRPLRQEIQARLDNALTRANLATLVNSPNNLPGSAQQRQQIQAQIDSVLADNLPTDPQLRLAIQQQIDSTLMRMRREHANAILERLSELLSAAPDRPQLIMDAMNAAVTPSDFLRWMRQIAEAPDSQPIPAQVTDYLDRLGKILYVVNRFGLSTAEATALLRQPALFNVKDVINPDLEDLDQLVTFTELKRAFNDSAGQLIRVFSQDNTNDITSAIGDLANWDPRQITALMQYFGSAIAYNRSAGLQTLQRAFALAETLQVEIDFLIQLASTNNLTIAFYRQQSTALLEVLRARYDDDQWPRVYKPIRDRLALQKRDALLSYALPRQLGASFQGRRDADVLYEYLLLDVQIGSEVETSRIAQGVAALQLYVQRCLMSLEKGVDPATVPADQWNWMKNYRVWEANRKVFLYPENYIEPELRDTKTPLFEELEQELMQGEINPVNVETAFSNYLNKLAELADLKIVGAYQHKEFEESFIVPSGSLATDLDQLNRGEIPVNVRSALASRQILIAPNATLNRVDSSWRLTDRGRTYTIRIDGINDDLISLTVETPPLSGQQQMLFLVGRTSTQPTSYYYRELLIDDNRWLSWKKIDLTINAEFVTPVYAFNRLFLFWVEFTEASRQNSTVYRATIRYSYLDRTNAWVTPQTYEEVERELAAEERFNPQWQRVYALRLRTLNLPGASSPQSNNFQLTVPERERILVIYGVSADQAIPVQTLRNAREREQFTLNFVNRPAASGVRHDVSLSLPFQGRIASSFRSNLDAASSGENLSQEFRDALLSSLEFRPRDSNGVSLSTNVIVKRLGSDKWSIIDRGSRTRLLIRMEAEHLNVYSFSQSSLHLAQTEDSSINNYVVASNPAPLVQDSSQINPILISNTVASRVSSVNVLLRELPLEASLMDVNNQSGWYVLDTGEEQFLLTVNNLRSDTDAERLRFFTSSQGSEFTFSIDPDFRISGGLYATTSFPSAPQFRFERLDTTAIRQLSLTLFKEGIDGLLSLRSQQTRERDFAGYLHNAVQAIPPGVDVSTTPYRAELDTIDFNGAFGLYYWELFFHIPFFIANQLSANQNFAEAQRWYHYIFNPTSQESGNGAASNCPPDQGYVTVSPNRDRYWQYLPFRNLCVDSITRVLDNQAALAEYRRDPFDPHAIAQLRINAYQKAIVMKYIDNLLDWGDYLFNQNNRESINEAVLYYVLAFNLLGPRPEGRANRRFEEIGDYNAIRQTLNNPPDFLTDFSRNGSIALPQNGNILTTFCVTENAEFVGFWDRVSDRLFKIRHSLNFEGVFRPLDLFQPALDVRALVAAFASGNRDISSILADVNRPVPHYRYSYMVDKAKEMTEIVISLGEKLGIVPHFP